MSPRRPAPPARAVVWAIARRELGIASRRKLVRFLFLVSLGIPLSMAIVLVVRVMTREAVGMDLGWDPVFVLLSAQLWPVGLIALGLGTPAVARDRAEEVLYLYAVRPVSPWTYTLGKMAAVAVPSLLLLLAPALLLAGIRQGILGAEVPASDTALLVLKAALVSVFMGAAYAGVTVGASASTRRGRWALLLVLAIVLIPDGVFQLVLREHAFGIGPANAAADLLIGLFDELDAGRALLAMVVLAAYAAAGAAFTSARVRREMIP